jgi:hypothetical protein
MAGEAEEERQPLRVMGSPSAVQYLKQVTPRLAGTAPPSPVQHLVRSSYAGATATFTTTLWICPDEISGM